MNQALTLLAALLLAAATGCRGLAAPGAGSPPPAVTVTVVEGTSSVPKAADRRIAARSAELVARHLATAGLTVRRVTDDDVIRDGLRDRVALLAYNPLPPPDLLQRFTAHLDRGGRLIVFYSGSDALAARLGFSLRPTIQAPDGQWASFTFGKERLSLLPLRVRQNSRILRPARPADDRARVIAWWEDEAGALQPQPAWTLSDRGAWMSHVLQDGDDASRRRLLLALVAHFEPRAIPAGAWRARTRCGAAAPFDTGGAMLAAWSKKSGAAPVSAAGFEAARSRLARLYDQGRFAEVIEEEEALAAKLAAACARAVPGVPGEFHAVWNHSGLGLYAGPDGWNRTAKRLAAHGIHAVFPNVARAGVTLYPGEFLPQSEAGQAAGDPLAACCAAAQKYGLAVHAWKICWSLEGAPAARVERCRAAGRLQVSDTGETLNWLCPSRADNVEEELAVIEEIATRYPVQGVHLDYIRFPDKHTCFCRSCRSAFEKAERVKTKAWPGDVRSGPLASRFRRWRAGQITRFVRLAAQRLRAARPDAALSAAVYGWYPGCIDSLGQDWGEWLKRNDVDFVCPMNYTDDTAQFTRWLSAQLPLAASRARIVPGIGATANESRLNGPQTLDQILAARRAGATGFILFDLNHTLEHDILPLLRLGVAKE